MISDLRLRDATSGDAEALGALHVAAWKETYTGLVPDSMLAALSTEARTQMWAEVLANHAPGAAVIVVEDRDRLVGFGACGAQRDDALRTAGLSGEFKAIYVLRSHQSRGAGRSILQAMAQKLSSLGHKAASLWVLRENTPARSFYEKLGGIIVGEKLNERPGATLFEYAYGWRDLSPLID